VLILILYHACSGCQADDHHCPVMLQDPVIGFYEERDLELFSSLNTKKEGVLLSLFESVQTSYGKSRLIHRLQNPIADPSFLAGRQRNLEIVLDEPDLRAEIKKHLAVIKQNEHNLYHFVEQEPDLLTQRAVESFYFSSERLARFNTSHVALDLKHVGKYFGLLVPVVEHLIFHFALEQIQSLVTPHHHDDSCKHDHHDHHKHHHHHHHFAADEHASKWVKNGFLVLEVGHLGLHLASMKETLDQLKNEKRLINELHQQLVSLKSCLKAVRSIVTLAQRAGYAPEFFGLQPDELHLFASAEFKEIESFVRDSYAAEGSRIGFFSRVGKALSYHQQLQDKKSQITRLMKVVGDLDALVAVADWYEKMTLEADRACFAEFLPSSCPHIEMKEMWHPAFDPATVVCNDLIMSKENGQHIILSGPNKAGKSSILKAIGINIILAQTYGICAAERAELTPFKKLMTHMVITDDIASGKSTMVSEMMRVDHLLATLHELKSGEFACVLVDDSLFRGTTIEKSAHLAQAFLQALSSYPGCCSGTATHLAVLTELADRLPHFFKNYRIGVITRTGGKAASTFKLEPGVADHAAVLDIVNDEVGYFFKLN
jgi:DNA mismatch repair ATPase MutS